MKNRYNLALACALGLASMPALSCTPEDALAKAEETAATIHRLADGDPETALKMHEELLRLQARDPTNDRHTACEAYDRVINELKKQHGEQSAS